MIPQVDVFHIVLVAGWFSSIFGGFKTWARLLEGRLRKRYPTAFRTGLIKVHVVTSDGPGEDKAYRQVEADVEAGKNVVLMVAGHSNGGRDGPCEASDRMRRFRNFVIPYVAVIDMTLAEMGCKIYNNVAWVDEFWAGLQKTDFVQKWKGVHRFYDLDKILGRTSHVGAATKPEVQNRIYDNFCNVIDSKPLNGNPLK